MRVFVTGVSGQLGWDVCRELARRGIEYRGVSSGDLDIRDAGAVERMLTGYAPDAVIHCAAWTKVDAAEDEQDACRAVNAQGTDNIARVCRQLDCKLVYISTDYVFSGEGSVPFAPDDPTAPRNVYGETKLAGEYAVKAATDKYFIVRISWVFGKNGSNFVKTMLRLSETHPELSVVADQIGSPTYTADLAPLLCDMVATEKYGTYHATNEGFCSWAEFAEEIFRQSGRTVKVRPIPTEAYPTRAVRPKNSRMGKDKLEENGFSRLPPWQDALKRYLKELE